VIGGRNFLIKVSASMRQMVTSGIEKKWTKLAWLVDSLGADTECARFSSAKNHWLARMDLAQTRQLPIGTVPPVTRRWKRKKSTASRRRPDLEIFRASLMNRPKAGVVTSPSTGVPWPMALTLTG
jgi:thiamine biosynthesis protein ThiC